MNRRNRTLIVVGLAVVLATLASFLVYRAIQSIPVREVTIVERQMVVATQRIDPGTTLTPELVRLTPWPADANMPGSFERTEDVQNRGVVSTILPNEPVTESKLAPTEAGTGVRPLIPEGMRAQAIRVNELIGVSGFVLPGSKVDVIAIGSPDTRGPLSKIVLNNIEILAINQDTSVPPEERSRAATVATVLVTPEDGERLALAASQSQIVLQLRNGLDVLPVETEGVRMVALFAEQNPQPQRQVTTSGRTRVTTPTPPPPPPPPTIEIISGAQRRTQEVKPGEPPTGGGSAGGAGSR